MNPIDGGLDIPNSDVPPEPPEPPEADRSRRGADGALIGCVFVGGTIAVLALGYLGFFAFALCNALFGWGLLHIDEETGEILTTIYYPLIWLCERAGIIP